MEQRNSFDAGPGSDLEGSLNSDEQDSDMDNSSQYTDSEERSGDMSNEDIDNL